MQSLIVQGTAIGTIVLQIFFVGILFAWIVNIRPVLEYIKKHGDLLVCLLSLGSIIGSLLYSLVLSFPPCDLCWYQRIALYPLAVIFGYSYIKKIDLFLIPGIILSSIGVIIAFWHNALFWFNASTTPCGTGVSCLLEYVREFGYITIPVMSLTMAALITLILAIRIRKTA